MVKHLHFVQSLEPLQGGGLGSAALGLHASLQSSGLVSQVVATRDAGFQRTWPGAEQYVRSGIDKAYYSKDLRAAAREKVGECSVVHSHGLYAYPNWAFGAEARRQDKPLVFHPHGFFDPWILSRSRIKKKIAHVLFENANFRHAALWRALTQKEAGQVRSQGITAPIVVAPNGINLEEVDSDEVISMAGRVPAKKRPHRLLFLARLHPKKGLDLLVKAWTTLQASFPDWELLIVGPDEGGYKKEVIKMVAEGGLDGCCTIHDAVSGAEKHAVVRSADMFVLPSYSEGFSVAVLEAAAHRLPVVMSDECNFPELETAGGAWVCTPNLESTTATLRKALEADAGERKQRGEIARQLIEQEYTWSRISAKINEACEALL